MEFLGKLLDWLKAYLTDQCQYVRINSKCSDSLPVLSGVPQGSSILGPFFVLFINNLHNCLNYSLPFIYADNTKCLRRTFSLDTPDIDLLHEDLRQCISMEPEQGPSVQFCKVCPSSVLVQKYLSHI